VRTDGPQDGLSPETARAVYRIVQESLRNAVRHSAGRTARVALTFGTRCLDVTVHDDGRGFDPNAIHPDGLGLASLRERALIAGGTVEIRSKAGQGTTVSAKLPLFMA
jgi:signal transduction histidine kinase